MKNSFEARARRAAGRPAAASARRPARRGRAIVGRSSSRKVGQLLEGAPQLVPPRGRDLRRVAGLLDPARHVALVRLELLDHAVRVGDEVLDDLVLVAEDPQHARGLAQARVGAAERLREVLRPAGEAGAERREDQAEALAVRAAQDVVDEVGGIVEVVCSTGTVPPSGSFSGELPGWQSTKYSPISDCGLMSQVASLRKSSKPGSVDLDGHDRLRRLALALDDAEVAGLCRRSRRPPGSRRPRPGRRRCRTRPGSACRRASRSRRRRAATAAAHTPSVDEDREHAPHSTSPAARADSSHCELAHLLLAPDVRAVGRRRLGGARAALVLVLADRPARGSRRTRCGRGRSRPSASKPPPVVEKSSAQPRKSVV